MAQQFRTAGADVQGMFTNDIVGSSHRRRRHPRPAQPAALRRGRAHRRDARRRRNTRRSVGGENDSPSRQLARFVTRRRRQRRRPACTSGSIYRRDRYLRGGDHIPFLERGFPAARFTEPNEDYAHQHQDVRVENGKQYGDLPEFCDFAFIARVARVNAATLWSLATAPGHAPQDVKILTAG